MKVTTPSLLIQNRYRSMSSCRKTKSSTPAATSTRDRKFTSLTHRLGAGESFTDSLVVATPPGSSGTWYAHVFTNVPINRYGDPILNRWDRSRFPDWVDYLARQTLGRWQQEQQLQSVQPIAVEYAEADLTISGLTAVPVDPDSGSLLDVSFTVTNSGTRATRVDRWTDRVFLTADTSIDAYDIELGNLRHDGILDIGESYDVSFQVRMPDNIGGDYHLVAFTDATFATGAYGRPLPYPETDGSNSADDRSRTPCSSSTAKGTTKSRRCWMFSLSPLPILVIDSLTHTTTVDVGEDFTFTYVYSNDGGPVPVATNALLRSRLSFSRRVSRCFQRSLCHGNQTHRSTGRQRDRDRSRKRFACHAVWSATTTSSSRPTFRVRRDRTAKCSKPNETNNVIVGDTPMLIVHAATSDLQVIDVSAAASGQVGDISSVSWTVQNTGDEQARARIADAVYLSADNVWDVGDLLLGRVDPVGVRTLNPGDTYQSSLDFEIPATLPGDYRIIVRTDIFDDVFEGENNRNNDLPSSRCDQCHGTAVAIGHSARRTNSRRVFRDCSSSTHHPVKRFASIWTAPPTSARTNCMPSTKRYRKPFDFDAAYQGYLKPDQSLVIPETLGGRYFVLARAGVRIDLEDQALRSERAPRVSDRR